MVAPEIVVVVYLHDNIRIQQNSRKHQTCQAKQDPQEKLLKTYKLRTLFTTIITEEVNCTHTMNT